MRSIEWRKASGWNCTGVVVGMIHGPEAVSKSRYDRPNVSPVKKPRLALSQMQWWCIAWPGVCRNCSGRPASSIVMPSCVVTIRAGSTGTRVPYERSISSAP
jgi:hypothetical protein